MALVINSNIASLQAQKNLGNTQANQATTFQRLSTGLRINSAKDDAGGLFLAQAQTKDIRGLNMATRNAGDGISMAQTAEGALDQIGKNLQRVNELAIQSANGTYSEQARGGLQKEVNELTQEVNRIIETTEFNGQKLLNSEATAETLQVSFDNNAGSRISTGMQGGMVKLDGMKDSTFFGASRSYDNATSTAVKDDFAEVLGFKNATTGSLAASVAQDSLIKEVNQALKAYQGDSATLSEAITEKFGASATGKEISFKAKGMEITLTVATDASGVASVTAATANYGGIKDATGTYQGGTNLALDEAALTTAIKTGDFSGAGTVGGFTIKTDTAVATFNANGLNDIIKGGLGGEKTIDISTQAKAQEAISQSRNAIDMISEVRAEFGANMNRFESVISGNQTYTENLSAARSRIEDADFAAETANLAKLQILQQAGTSILGQANASGQSVLGLL